MNTTISGEYRPGRQEVLGQDVAGITEVDVFAPATTENPQPVVVLLHGTTGDRSRMRPIGRAPGHPSRSRR